MGKKRQSVLDRVKATREQAIPRGCRAVYRKASDHLTRKLAVVPGLAAMAGHSSAHNDDLKGKTSIVL